MSIVIRRASPADDAGIRALVRAERLNPNGLHWPNFFVATDDGALAGAAQIRRHADASHELSSLVVAKAQRGRGLASRLIDALLAEEEGPVAMVTGHEFAAHYARWGFRPTSLRQAPRCVRRNLLLGQAFGGAHAVLTGRRVNWLVVLVRDGARENAAGKAV